MASELKPCPFCGGEPSTLERPDNIDGTEFFFAVACYCGGHSARAHQLARAKTPEKAKAEAVAAWNRRALSSPNNHTSSPTEGVSERERCARICETFAQMVDDGAGMTGRLWQVARKIREGDPVPSWYDPTRKEPADPRREHASAPSPSSPTGGGAESEALETVGRWTWEHDGMAHDEEGGQWVRLDDVVRALAAPRCTEKWLGLHCEKRAGHEGDHSHHSRNPCDFAAGPSPSDGQLLKVLHHGLDVLRRAHGVAPAARPSLWKPVVQPKALGGKDGVAMVQGAPGAEWVRWSDVAHLFAGSDWTPDTVPLGERAAEAIAEMRTHGVLGPVHQTKADHTPSDGQESGGGKAVTCPVGELEALPREVDGMPGAIRPTEPWPRTYGVKRGS